MANELKPCPFCGGTAHQEYNGALPYVRCEDCGASVDGRSGAWNTRPAAPVEGLETVARYGQEDYVTRSQAEAIIAAKDAEIERLKSLLKTADDLAWQRGSVIDNLEADNAALAERVKELEEYAREATKAITGLSGGGSENFSNPIGDLYPADLPFCLERIRERYVSKVGLKRLETQLAAAKKALEFYSNLDNWKNGRFEQVEGGTVLRHHPSSAHKDRGAIARAALEDRP